MSAQIIVAVDEPNIRLRLEELGQQESLDYRKLLRWCKTDGACRLASYDPVLKPVVFKPVEMDDHKDSFATYLRHAGWQTLFKPGPRPATDPPLVLKRLKRQLRAMKESTVQNLDTTSYADVDRALYDFVMEFGQSIPWHDLVGLRLSRRFLQYSSVRRYAYWRLQQLQPPIVVARQESFKQGLVRDGRLLLEAYPQFQARFNLSSDYSSEYVGTTVQEIVTTIGACIDAEHRDWDIDADLSSWVLTQVKPDGVGGLSDLPAVVYLVGADFNNFLPLAERLKRYGAQPVLITVKGKLDQLNRQTRRGMELYDVVFIEDIQEQHGPDKTPCVA